MPTSLETYRNRRSETGPIVIGANAMALRRESIPQSQIRILNPEIQPPVKIEDFLKRKHQILPQTSDAATREQIIGNSTEAEPEKFIEREIDPDKPWSAFGQVMFIKEHVVDGKVIKKIAAISIAYPGGVGTRMAREALSKTSGIEESGFESWKGEHEGSIIAASKEVPDIMKQFDLMDGFVENSGSVISERHSQTEHEVVQHFFGLQDARKEFLDTVKAHAAEILANPQFTGRSAFDERYAGKGIYLIEGIVEDGIWDGGDPSGKRMRLVDMAADDAHLKWLQWAEKTASSIKGDGVIFDAEDTETVENCGGANNKCGEKKGCAAFFKEMEGGDLFDHNGINIKKYMALTGAAGAVLASESPRVLGGGAPAAGYDKENCSSCGKEKYKEDGCKCSAKS